ncbi:hypothetical protein NKR19_g265 [Coniochaeta hoffmannii]|uniref:Uncharacterized protein n=1 Tax=Coniochaeta hoffmannii TaxID=91930 RepID=A0AA38VU13_9PEZI|nr:hypothetical protein NKR19_g265 [Coniochaeta hoffmannii]
MFSLLEDPYTCLTTTLTVLVELRYALYLVRTNTRKTFPPLAFAADLDVGDSRSAMLRSLDDACLARIREATRYVLEGAGDSCRPPSFIDYEADRYVVWAGLDEAKLPLSTLSDGDVAAQLEVMGRRGCGDRIRVHMAIEVDTGGGGGGGEGGCDGEEEGDDESVGSDETMVCPEAEMETAE